MPSNNQELQNAVLADPTLTPQQKQKIVEVLSDGDKLPRLLTGALGSAVGVAIAKYMKLSKVSKVLLGVAGFGIGRLLYDVLSKHDGQFASYNSKIRAYEMDTTRY
jgi:hypothetical protein